MESVAAAADAFLAHLSGARQASPHTLRAYRHELDRLLTWLAREAPDIAEVRALDGRTLRSFLAGLASDGLTPASLARAVAALRSFGRFLATSERLDANPAGILRAPRQGRKLPHHLEHAEIAALLAAPLAHARSPQIRIEADAHRLSLCNVSDAPPAALLVEGAAGRQPGLKGPASGGQGLGLSIVRRLAERHGLSLTLSHEQGHTCATLTELVGFTGASPPAV